MGSGYQILNGEAVIRLDTNIYPKKVIENSIYIYLNDYYFIIDGDDKQMILKVKPKNKDEDLKKFTLNFFNQLVSITNYSNQLNINKDVLNTILQRALISACPDLLNKK